MVLTKEQIDKIREIINTHFSVFVIENLGADQLSDEDIRKLKDLGILDQVLNKEDLFSRAYLVGKDKGGKSLIKKTKGTRSISNNDINSINYVRQSAGHYIKNLENTSANIILTTILDKNKYKMNDIVGEMIKTPIEEAIRESKTIYELTRDLREITGDIVRDFKRVAVTELNTAYNQGSLVSIVDRNRGKEKEDINAYVQVVLDERTCNYCKSLYLNKSLIPKVRKLSDFVEQGSNIGKKVASWSFVVPPMHPNCRCRLVELLPGWTLDAEGKQVFVSPDYDELKDNPED